MGFREETRISISVYSVGCLFLKLTSFLLFYCSLKNRSRELVSSHFPIKLHHRYDFSCCRCCTRRKTHRGSTKLWFVLYSIASFCSDVEHDSRVENKFKEHEEEEEKFFFTIWSARYSRLCGILWDMYVSHSPIRENRIEIQTHINGQVKTKRDCVCGRWSCRSGFDLSHCMVWVSTIFSGSIYVVYMVQASRCDYDAYLKYISNGSWSYSNNYVDHLNLLCTIHYSICSNEFASL